MPTAVSITTFLDIYCAYNAYIEAKSALQLFLCIRPKLLKLAWQNFSKISDTKGREENNFSSLGWGKKGENQNFFQNLRGGPKPYTLCVL